MDETDTESERWRLSRYAPPEPESSEWTVAKLASYIDRDGRLDDKRLLQDINAALAVERQKHGKGNSLRP